MNNFDNNLVKKICTTNVRLMKENWDKKLNVGSAVSPKENFMKATTICAPQTTLNQRWKKRTK